jgi:glycosyltransferase involved in cell wall biosynthesis
VDIDKITVALATYRRPLGLRDALNALSAQGFKRLCVLVSDDDPCEVNRQTAAINRSFEVNYLPQACRKGVLKNHLSMIEKVQSDLFMFHGDDDQLLPGALTNLSEMLKTSLSYDAVFSNYRLGENLQISRHVNLEKIPFVRYWRHRNRKIRLLSYYLCPAFLGKQNLFYGLYRTEAVEKINIKKALPPRKHLLNLDEMFSFQAVCNGPILVISNVSYFFSDGNAKYYVDSKKKRSGWGFALLDFMAYEWITLFDYLRNVNNASERSLILVFFPLKVIVAMVWRYFRCQ